VGVASVDHSRGVPASTGRSPGTGKVACTAAAAASAARVAARVLQVVLPSPCRLPLLCRRARLPRMPPRSDTQATACRGWCLSNGGGARWAQGVPRSCCAVEPPTAPLHASISDCRQGVAEMPRDREDTRQDCAGGSAGLVPAAACGRHGVGCALCCMGGV
jgi:hypothetical protein